MKRILENELNNIQWEISKIRRNFNTTMDNYKIKREKNNNMFAHWIKDYDNKKENELFFNGHSFTLTRDVREKIVRNILCDLKTYLDYEQNYFDISFEKNKYLKVGFEYDIKISIKKGLEDNEDAVEYFETISEFVWNTINYIFYGLDVCRQMYSTEMIAIFGISAH